MASTCSFFNSPKGAYAGLINQKRQQKRPPIFSASKIKIETVEEHRERQLKYKLRYDNLMVNSATTTPRTKASEISYQSIPKVSQKNNFVNSNATITK